MSSSTRAAILGDSAALAGSDILGSCSVVVGQSSCAARYADMCRCHEALARHRRSPLAGALAIRAPSYGPVTARY